MPPQLSNLSVLIFSELVVCLHLSDVTILDVTRYFPDYSRLPDDFPCSEQEIECFKKRMLLYKADGQCYSPGERGPCAEGQIFHADDAEATRRGGHLRGTCEKLCPGLDHAPLAATGQCMSRSEVQSEICPAKWYLQPKLDIFGQWNCDWSIIVCPQKKGILDLKLPRKGLCSFYRIYPSLIRSDRNVTDGDYIPDDHPLLRYFSNHTFLEREFQCTEEEKTCFQYNRTLGNDGNCYNRNQFVPNDCNDDETYNLDLDEANKNGGKIEWVCSPECDNHGSIFKPQKCTYSDSMYREICRESLGLELNVDAFGRMTCRCKHSDFVPMNLRPTLTSTSVTPGFCRLPDFSKPVKSPEYDWTLTEGFEGPCSEEEFACLQQGKVFSMGDCYSLRTRGPCAIGEELLLDKEALAHAQLKAKCASTPCPEGSVRMPIDGKCLTHQEATSVLCPDKIIALDEFGGWRCGFYPKFAGNLSSTVRLEGICHMEPTIVDPVTLEFGSGSYDVGGGVGRR